MCSVFLCTEATPSRIKSVRGFTLVELMVTIAIAAILLAIAVPSFSDATLTMKLNGYANSLASSSLLARSEAIKRNAVVTMCSSANGTSCDTGGWQEGWIVLTGTTVLQRQTASSNGFHINGTVTGIDYQPSGVGTTQATLTVCRATPSAGSQERVVTVNATGRATITKTAVGSCT